MPKRAKIPVSQLADLMKHHNGDFDAVAEVTGFTKKYLQQRIKDTPQLAALWLPNGQNKTLDANSADVTIRKPPNKKNSDLLLEKRNLEVMEKNGRDVFFRDVSELLHNKDSIKKLELFKGFEGNMGLFMSRCLELTHQVNLRQNTTLWEIAEKLSEEIMGGKLDDETFILKTRLFIQACEQQGKFHDRLLRGLETMLKLTEKEVDVAKKKAGFQPLKDLKKLEQTLDADS